MERVFFLEMRSLMRRSEVVGIPYELCTILTPAPSHSLILRLYDHPAAIQPTIDTILAYWTAPAINKHGLTNNNAPDAHVTLPIGKSMVGTSSSPFHIQQLLYNTPTDKN